jgi:polysaccharide pyruvyl transferase WcaK-like protein
MAARQGRARILIVGVAGHNRGDDAIAHALVARLRKELGIASFAVTVLRPGVFHEPDVREVVVNRKDPTSHARLAHAVWESSLVLLGGGSIIQDEFGATWLRGIMALFAEVVWLAELFGRPLATAPIGVDVLRSEQGRRMARFILGRCQLLAVRDRRSLEHARQLLGERTDIVLGADPAFELPRRQRSSSAPMLVIAPAFEATSPPELPSLLAAIAQAFLAQRPGGRCQLLAMDERSEEDAGRARAILTLLPVHLRSSVELVVPRSLDATVSVLERASALVCMRLHAMILALGATPTFCISRGVKTDALATELGVPFVSLRGAERASVEAQTVRFFSGLKHGEAALADSERALATQRVRLDGYVGALREMCLRHLGALEVAHDLV